MRQRHYEVDDHDYLEHRVNGGTMSPAEFFTERLGITPPSGLHERLGLSDNKPLSLIERIKKSLEE